MSDLTSARAEANNAVTTLATNLAAAKSLILTKQGELAAAVKNAAAIEADHVAALAMVEAGRVVAAVEKIGPAIGTAIGTAETDVASVAAKVEASPWGKALIAVLGVSVVVVAAFLAWPHVSLH